MDIETAEHSKFKVVQFVECWLPQTETWLFNHVSQLPPEIESTVVCRWTQNLAQFPFTRIRSIERLPERRTLASRVLGRLGIKDEMRSHLGLLEQVIRDFEPGVVHSHFGNWGWVNATLVRKLGLPHVVSFYGFDVGLLSKGDSRWYSRYKQMSKLVDLVLCEGPYMAKSIEALGIDKSKIQIFRLGIDLEQLPFIPRKNAKGARKRFLIAGTFREKKGIPFAFEALGMLRATNPKIEVTLIGDAGESQREQLEKQKILAAVQRAGLADCTRFRGYQPYRVLLEEFYKHDVFLAPSVTAADGDTEGGAPVSIIEAAASGMPIVSTSHCDIPYVLSKQNSAYFAKERDSLGLLRALQALLDLDDWEPLLVANRLFIETELDVRKQAQKLARLYLSFTEEPLPEQVKRISPATTVPG